MRIEWLAPEISSYRGHCIGIISNSRLSTSDKIRLTKQLPKVVTYDEFVGLSGILCGVCSSYQIQKMFNKLFHRSSLVDLLDEIIDFVNRI